MTLNGPVANGQTLNFNSVSGAFDPPRLILGDVQDLAGTVSGFDHGGAADDEIVLNSAAWQYEGFAANMNGTGGALMFANGGAVASVSMSGSYNPNGFHAVVLESETTIACSG